ncbi:BRO-N domain-containing protein [Streptomyces sp. NBC_01334]|uniref:BRO-N domain-containing protein n=1 Tax=Streptomyces sp. NBC_01334 TaxID=2903827 RepID=UPI002E1629C3
MYEQNNTPPPDRSAAQQDAIEISDFVYAATGARVRRLTTPDGTHWFPAVDLCKNLGYAHVGSTLRNTADAANVDSLGSVLLKHTLSIPAGREWRRDMKLVNLQGLILMVNSCTKPESQPFKTWVAGVIATLQRDGSYSLAPAAVQPAPAGGTAYVMPEQVVDAIVRLEERNMQVDEKLAAVADEQNDLLRQINTSLQDIAAALNRPDDRSRPSPAPELTPQQLLAKWRRTTSPSLRTCTRWPPVWSRRCCTAGPGIAWKRSPPTPVCRTSAYTTAWSCCSSRGVSGMRVVHRTGARSAYCRNAVTP